ncbi:MAG: peptide ABC transporter substrate-binding protein [Pseudomonadota bacterium]
MRLVTILLAALGATALPAVAVTPAVDPVNNEISIAIDQEPQWLTTIKATDTVAFRIIDHITEGLLTRDANNRLVGGVAERWELTDEKATFWLRRDARWSDGEPVTAHDFVFAWRKVATPETAAEYGFLMRMLRNGEAILAGEMPPESLGVRAIDDYTLEVELVSPIAYFLDLVTFISFRPVREDFYDAQQGRYAADAINLLSNGPFILSEWVHGASMRMEKNPYYWNRDAIPLDAINIPYITRDTNARFNLYMDDKTAMATRLQLTAMKMAMQEHQKLKSFRDGSVFYLGFNHRPGRPTANRNLRRAIQSVYDVSELTYKVIGVPGNTPAYTLFPAWLEGDDGQTLQAQYPPPRSELSIERGRQYLELARQELGVEEIPPLSILLDDTANANSQAEYFQNVMARTLGLEIRLDKQIFKQRLAKMSAGDYDIVAAGWSPDYNDPMTFADLLASWNLNNRGRYSNPDYDALIIEAQQTTDQQRRNEIFAELQDIIHDDVVILPQYERGFIYAQDKRIGGVRRYHIGGDPNFNYTYIIDRENNAGAED